MLPATAFAITVSPRPDPGTTQGQPFEHNPNTADSDSFRIPGLVTLRDGTLLATADARWNTSYDGGGLDTIVSRSTDNGASWSYSFANYLGDNGNEYNGSGSTCFIDPSLAVVYDEASGSETIYLLADLYPYGVALNGSGQLWPSKESGFDAQGRLLLSTDPYGSEVLGNNVTYTYGYYLDQSSGTIKSIADDTEVEGLSVDDHFNVTGTYSGNEVNSNLFFSDSPFKVQRTSFLYLVTSTDGGRSWSAPSLIPLKSASERAYLAAPSRGLVTSRGEIVFPCYSYDNLGSTQPQYVSFIYSTDGVNWLRSVDDPQSTGSQWNSESVAVELSDGRLRFFARNNYTARLSYFDYVPGSGGLSDGTWKAQTVTDVVTNSNCQISAIKYSRTSEGKDVLLISCPTGPNENGSTSSSGDPYPNGARLNGKIFVARVNEDSDKTLEWVDAAKIDASGKDKDNDSFMYSALTEITKEGDGCQPGDIAILYEMNQAGWGAGPGMYYEMHFQTHSLSGIDFDPMFVKQPAYSGPDLSLGGDAAVTLDVEVDLTEGVTYQWYRETNGEGPVALDGATDPSYTVDIDALGVGSHYLFCRITKGSYTMDSDQVLICIVPADAETFTITLDPAGGTVEPAALNTDAEGKLSGELPVPERDGYIFKGWFTQSTDGEKVTGDTVFHSNATIFAQWEKGSDVQLVLTASPASLTGGGSVTLSLTGLPEAGTVTVTCDIPSITVTSNENGTYTAVLPNSSGTYTFRAVYHGADGYGDATAECTVSVTAQSSSGGSSSGSSSSSNKDTVTKNPDGSVTTTSTDKKTGTVTATTERPDGTKEIVVTEKNGTVTTTTEQTDGGKEILETRPDGTVISTAIDPDGGAVEKVTDANKDIAITVSSSDGKTLAHIALPAQIPPPEKEFVDVPKDHWAEQGIHEMASLGVISGTGDDRYDMDANLQRGDLAAMLFRLSNGDAEYTSSFEDVPADKYYAKSVVWASEVGIVRGDGNGRFRPENSITREELAVVLFNYANLLHLDTSVNSGALNDFTDGGQTNGWAQDGMAWCINHGILSGRGGGILDPGAKITRAETAVMLQRFLVLVK